jgi:AcrR family transcriptional regulator
MGHVNDQGQPPRLSGRRAQAAGNDEAILNAAREVFIADPEAPISAVAERAGVGISALYRRYASKQELLGTLCAVGQEVYLAELERALADRDGDPWSVYVGWLERIVDADTHALTVRLAGTFEPTPEHLGRAERMQTLGRRLFDRTKAAGCLRPGLTFLDVSFLLELVASSRLGDAKRSAELRRRLLAVIVDGMAAPAASRPLPGRAPTWAEQTARWIPPTERGRGGS